MHCATQLTCGATISTYTLYVTATISMTCVLPPLYCCKGDLVMHSTALVKVLAWLVSLGPNLYRRVLAWLVCQGASSREGGVISNVVKVSNICSLISTSEIAVGNQGNLRERQRHTLDFGCALHLSSQEVA